MGQCSWEREGLEHGKVREECSWGQERLCVARRVMRRQKAPPAHLLLPSRGPPVGGFQTQQPSPRWEPLGSPGAADKLEQGLCSVFTSWCLLKDALCGPQKVPAWVSPGASREKANPAPCRQLCCGRQHWPPREETANSGHVAPHRPLKARG